LEDGVRKQSGIPWGSIEKSELTEMLLHFCSIFSNKYKPQLHIGKNHSQQNDIAIKPWMIRWILLMIKVISFRIYRNNHAYVCFGSGQ
jgi:hypothetical protein